MKGFYSNYKLKIAYDGTAYAGWQVQPNGISIQEILQQKISLILRQEILLIGSGRTDAGVHALGQIANFHSLSISNLSRFLRSLNALLPPDIRILQIAQVSNEFHSRYDAIGKTYYYHLHLERHHDPFKRLYSLYSRQKIDRQKLSQAASFFVGTHDFTSFSNESHKGSASKNPIRTLKRLDIVEEKGGLRLEFEGDGFLYKMVRNIVGTLLEIASGKRFVEELPNIFLAKNRNKAGQTAPPHPLFLTKVDYPQNVIENLE